MGVTVVLAICECESPSGLKKVVKYPHPQPQQRRDAGNEQPEATRKVL